MRQIRVPRPRSAAVLACALCIVLAVPAHAADQPPAPPAPVVLAPLDLASGSAATTAGVAAAVGPLVHAGLRDASVIVSDPVTGTVLFAQQPSRGLIPASTTKLITAASALDVLGPQTRIPTIAYRRGATIYLVGGGDPTLARSGGDPLGGGSSSLRSLANQTVRDLTANSRFRLVYDDSAFRGPSLGPGWPRASPAAGVAAPVTALVVDGGRIRPGGSSRVSDPSRQAAQVFAGLLRTQGLVITSVTSGVLDRSATELARVESAPVADIVQVMLTDSENNYAEALAHLTGGVLLGDPSFDGGAAAATKQLGVLGIDTAGLTLVDGSGLSGRDRVPARVLADLLEDVVMAKDPDLSPIVSGLAVAGLTGTLADRFDTAATRPGRGVVHAKTGTLTGVVSLAGTVLDADGRLLVFAMIANKVRSLAKARDTMDRVASRLAACGCS